MEDNPCMLPSPLCGISACLSENNPQCDPADPSLFCWYDSVTEDNGHEDLWFVLYCHYNFLFLSHKESTSHKLVILEIEFQYFKNSNILISNTQIRVGYHLFPVAAAFSINFLVPIF